MVFRLKPPSLYARFKWWLEGKFIFKKTHVKRRRTKRRPRMPRYAAAWSIIILSAVGAAASFYLDKGLPIGTTAKQISCSHPYIIDGDTLDCSGTRIRLSGIDTPEMPGHCRKGRECTAGDPYAARDALQRLTRTSVTCRQEDIDHYGRVIARCKAGGEDLSCALLDSGHAVRRYSYIFCM